MELKNQQIKIQKHYDKEKNMGYFMDYYKVEVEGSADTVKSICEAIKGYSHEDCKSEQNGSEILIWDTLRVTSDIDTAYDFAILC